MALLRGGGLPDPAATELVAGRVRALPTLAAAEAEAVLALRSGLALALVRREAGAPGGERPGRIPEVRLRPLVRLGPDDMLRPELALLAPLERRGATRAHGRTSRSGPPPAPLAERLGGAGAAPGEVLLAVELAAAAPARLGAYARAAVREVWVLDLERSWTEAYRAPWTGAFTSRTLWYAGEEVPVGALPGLGVEALPFA